MRRRRMFAATALLGAALLGSGTGTHADEVMLRCGRVLDMTASDAREAGTIWIKDGRIEAVASKIDSRGGIPEIDLSDYTCLPGLIDLHAHILINPTSMSDAGELGRSSADRALDGLHNAQVMLRSGFTTLRDPGDFDVFYASVAVKRALARGAFIGPDLFVAPHLIGPTGGHSDVNTLQPEYGVRIPSRVADGPDEIRRLIREEVKHGADWIKVMATGGVMSAGDNPNHTAYTPEELAAAVDETHRLGRKITVHAIGTEGIKAALRAGVDCVEHGILIDDEGIELMKQQGTWLVPTLYVLNYVVEEGPRLGYPEESIAKGRALLAERDRRLRHAFASGVPVAFGSDTIFPHDQAAREFAQLVRLGMASYDAIRAATVNAADVLGIGDEVGTLAPGKVADVIAVRGNPLERIERLEDVRFVMKRGHVVKQP